MSGDTIRQIILIGAVAGCAAAQPAGTFTSTGAMTTARAGHTATLLTDGRVLIAGGSADASAEIYNPATGTFESTGDMSTPRHNATATLLADGRVLVAGGNPTGLPQASSELYDPASGAFTATGRLTYPRSGHTAILLATGKVLIVGGYGAFGAAVAQAELYDPATGSFTVDASFLESPRCDFCPPAVLLKGGRVLFPATSPAQVYDPATAAFSWTGSMIDDQNAATSLINGKVLLAGGEDDFGRKNSAELYDLSTGVFSVTGSMVSRRSGHTLTLLADGRALVVGGETDECANGVCMFAGTLATAELYDPESGTFSEAATMTVARETQSATLLNDGRVLVAGGVAYGGIGVYLGPTATAELYTPPVLLSAPRLSSVTGRPR